MLKIGKSPLTSPHGARQNCCGARKICKTRGFGRELGGGGRSSLVTRKLPPYGFWATGRQYSLQGESLALETIENLVGPEPLEAGQGLVQAVELVDGQAHNLLHGLELAVVERIDPVADFLALGCQADAN